MLICLYAYMLSYMKSSTAPEDVKKPSYIKLQTDENCTKINSVLLDLLPDDYEYKVISFNMIKKSDVVGESQFNLECRININDMSKWIDLFDTFCAKSGTLYNKSTADKVGTKRVTMSRQKMYP